MPQDRIDLSVNFPLADGRAMVKGPLTYNADGLYTVHSVDWMHDPRFVEAYRAAMSTGHRWGENLHIEWRVYLPCWAATVASKLEGDFVECGVDTGMCSRAVCSYIGFEKFPERRFYLLDTFDGFPVDQMTPAERATGLAEYFTKAYCDTYELVRGNFREYANVVLVKGRVPDTLAQVPSEKIAYLMLDMNAAVPELAAMEYFWDKLVPGAPVVFDDYGFLSAHEEQRKVLAEFARSRGVEIFQMPSGQAFLLKPRA
jgi:hypothetical protein